jgi:hypothetical protein
MLYPDSCSPIRREFLTGPPKLLAETLFPLEKHVQAASVLQQRKYFQPVNGFFFDAEPGWHFPILLIMIIIILLYYSLQNLKRRFLFQCLQRNIHQKVKNESHILCLCPHPLFYIPGVLPIQCLQKGRILSIVLKAHFFSRFN